MRLATRDNGTPDGELVVVSTDGTRALAAPNWPNLLAAIAARIACGVGQPLDHAGLRAPLPRSWQWLDANMARLIAAVRETESR